MPVFGAVSTEHDFMQRFGETDIWYKKLYSAQ